MASRTRSSGERVPERPTDAGGVFVSWLPQPRRMVCMSVVPGIKRCSAGLQQLLSKVPHWQDDFVLTSEQLWTYMNWSKMPLRRTVRFLTQDDRVIPIHPSTVEFSAARRTVTADFSESINVDGWRLRSLHPSPSHFYHGHAVRLPISASKPSSAWL